MALVKKSITVTDRQEQWIRAQIASGDYGTDSEYFRDLIRRDQERNAQFRALKQAIQEGLDSGAGDKTVRGDLGRGRAALQSEAWLTFVCRPTPRSTLPGSPTTPSRRSASNGRAGIGTNWRRAS